MLKYSFVNYTAYLAWSAPGFLLPVINAYFQLQHKISSSGEDQNWFQERRLGEPIFIRARYGIGGRPGYEREWRADPEVVGGGQLTSRAFM